MNELKPLTDAQWISLSYYELNL